MCGPSSSFEPESENSVAGWFRSPKLFLSGFASFLVYVLCVRYRVLRWISGIQGGLKPPCKIGNANDSISYSLVAAQCMFYTVQSCRGIYKIYPFSHSNRKVCTASESKADALTKRTCCKTNRSRHSARGLLFVNPNTPPMASQLNLDLRMSCLAYKFKFVGSTVENWSAAQNVGLLLSRHVKQLGCNPFCIHQI